MTQYGSIESDGLERLITRLTERYKWLLNQGKTDSAKRQQQDVMFLKNEILPIVLKNTSIYHNEISKYTIMAYENAQKISCNTMIINLPIHDNYKDEIIVGIANPRDYKFDFPYTGKSLIYCSSVDFIPAEDFRRPEEAEVFGKIKVKNINIPTWQQ